MFDHLVNTLGALTQDLQPDVILLLPPDPLRGAQFRTIAAGGSGSIDPFLSGPSDLDLGVGVKIPLGFVLTPIVKPVRWLLGVRIIEGSVLADPQGYTVLVRSSSGEVWQARLRGSEGSPGSSGARQRLPGPGAGAGVPDHERRADPGQRGHDALVGGVRPSSGWASSSGSKYAVQSGEQDPDALTKAIRGFRAAIGVDPAFALAHYRLGLALQKDRQPIAAAEALRTSLKANPGFVPARVALASVLYGSTDDVDRAGRAVAGRHAAGTRRPGSGWLAGSRRRDAGHRWSVRRRAAQRHARGGPGSLAVRGPGGR